MAAPIGKVSIELEARFAKLESDFKRAGSKIEAFAKGADSRLASVEKSMRSMDKSAERAANTVDNMSKRMKQSLTGISFAFVAHQIQGLVDGYANLTARVKLAAGANANFAASMNSVKKVAMSTYASLEATAGLVQKISQALQNTGQNATSAFEQAVKLTEVFNKSLVVSGAGTIQAEAAMLQFSQAIAKGKLDGDEFRSVMENNSRFMLLLAQSLGVTFKELYRLREAGALTNDMIFKVTENTKALNAEFESFPVTISRAAQNLTSALQTFVGQTDSAVGASRALANAVNTIAHNFDAIANVAVAGGAIFLMAKGFTLVSEAAQKASKSIADTRAAALAANLQQEASAAVSQQTVAAAQRSLAAAKAKEAEIRASMAYTAQAKAELAQRIASTQASIAALQKEAMTNTQLAATRKALAASSAGYFSPATLRVMNESTAALARNGVITATLANKTRELAQAKAAFSSAMAKSAVDSIAVAGAMAQVTLATSNLSAAQSSAIKSSVATTTAWASMRAAGAGLLNLIGGWPVVIAAATYATYAWITAETDAERMARESADAFSALAGATGKLEKARLQGEFNKKYEEQRAEVERLNAEFMRLVALQEQIYAVGGGKDVGLQASIKSVGDRATAAAEAFGELNEKMLKASGMNTAEVFENVHGAVDLLTNPLDNLFSIFERGETAVKLAEFSLADFAKELEDMYDKQVEANIAAESGAVAVLMYKRGLAVAAGASQDYIKSIDEQIERIREQINIGKEIDERKKAEAKSFKDGAKSIKEHSDALKENANKVLELKDKLMALQAEALGPIAKIEYDAADAAMDFADALVEAGGDVKLLTSYMAALIAKKEQDIDATHRQNEENARQADVIGRLAEEYAQEAATFGLRGRALFVLNELQRVQNEYLETNGDLVGFNAEEVSRMAGEQYDLGTAMQNSIAILERYEDTIVSAFQGGADAFGDMFSDIISGNADIEDAFENLGNALVNIIADTVGQMISEFLKLQIINPMLNSIFSGFGGNLLPTAQGGGLLGNIMSAFQGGGGGFGGIISSIFGGGGSGALTGGGLLGLGGMFGGTGAASAAANLGSVGITGISGLTGNGLAGLGGSVGTFGGAASGGSMAGFMGIPVVGWILAGMALNDSLFGAGWKPNGGTLTLPNGQQTSGGGSGFGRALDSMFNPGGLLGDRIGSILSGSATITRLFGRKAPELQGGTTTMSLGPGGPGGSEVYRTIERGGIFRSDRRRTHRFGLGEEAQEAVEQLFDDVQQVMRNAADMMRGEAPEMISAALRTVMEYDKDGKVKATKYFVDVLGRSWEEASAEAATTRITAEAMIATIDAILGTTVEAAAQSIGSSGAAAIAGGIDMAIGGALDSAVTLSKTEQLMGEASAIAERWRSDAETLMDGATFLLAAATDIRAGTGLLGSGGTLTQIADLIEELQAPGETLVATYARLVMASNLLSDAMELSGINLDMTREQFVRFAVDIADAAGGIERAQQLWSTYFETFFTAAERAELARSRAQTSAESQFQDIGLDVNDFLGEGGLQRFRDAFKGVFASLSASEVVEWLEAAEALGILNDAIAALGDTAGSTGTLDDGPLQDLMRQIKEEMMSFAPPQTFEQRMAAINAETQVLVERAAALGASEAQLTLIRELGIQRQNQLLEEQAAIIQAQVAAQQELGQYLANLEALSTSSGISPLTQELQRLRSEYQQHIDRINELAIASGRAGASQEELAVASNWYAAQLEMAAERLIQSGISLVQRLYGGTQASGGSSSGSGSWVGGGSSSGGLSGVEQAVEDRYAREMELLKNLGEYLESLGLSNLSPLTPSERLQEAQSQYNEILMRAMGGDLDALGQLQGAANAYLGEAQSYYGGVGAYSGIFEGVQSQIRAILDRGPLNSPLPDAPPTEVTGIGGGGVTVEAGESFTELSELERMAIANELAVVLRDLITLTGDSLLEVANQLGLDLREFVADLGVNLDDLTVETAVALTDIARTLGVELADLGNSVGVDLGRLGDEQSLLNDALEQTINSLPTEFRDRLRTHLEAIENATTEADANEAIQNAEDAINLLPAGIRDALAPFFGGVTSPGDALLAEAVATTQNTARMNTLQEQANAFLESIAQNTLGDPPDLPPPDPIAPSVPDLVSNISADLRSPEAKESDLVAEISALRSEVVSLRSAVAMASSKDVEAASRIESAIKSAPPGSRRQ